MSVKTATIAAHFDVSRPTVKTHVAAVNAKLGVTTRDEAVAMLGRLSTWIVGVTEADDEAAPLRSTL